MAIVNDDGGLVGWAMFHLSGLRRRQHQADQRLVRRPR